MTTLKNRIKLLKIQGLNRDTIYELLVSYAGLYCIAFFGYKGTATQKRRLRYIWKQIIIHF